MRCRPDIGRAAGMQSVGRVGPSGPREARPEGRLRRNTPLKKRNGDDAALNRPARYALFVCHRNPVCAWLLAVNLLIARDYNFDFAIISPMHCEVVLTLDTEKRRIFFARKFHTAGQQTDLRTERRGGTAANVKCNENRLGVRGRENAMNGNAA